MNNETMLNSTALPHDRSTFESCKLDFSERAKHEPMYLLTQQLISLRKADATFSRQERGTVDGAILSDEAFVLRFFGATPADDRLLLVNLGRDLDLMPGPEPLLAPPYKHDWANMLSTEEPRFGGSGAPHTYEKARLYLTAHSAVVLSPCPLQGQ